jgi:Flp pilus assembly protein TadG
MRFRRWNSPRHRRGNVLILTAFLMVLLMALLALAIDVGYLFTARTELQRSADAAALAAAAGLIDPESINDDLMLQQVIAEARQQASAYAARNLVCSAAPVVDPNLSNAPDGDVLVGYLSDFSNPAESMMLTNVNEFNAVTVRVRCLGQQNARIPLFFAQALGYDDTSLEARATAAFVSHVRGFQARSDGGNVHFLPIALDEESWNALVAGYMADNTSWDAENEVVHPWGDGLPEVNLFPEGTGAPGNRGMVDIGDPNNSTNDVRRQILYGISPSDLAYHGGKLELDEYGELALNGDTGISAGVKEELASIIGQTRFIPVFDEVSGPGNNAMYTIVKFVGIRILEVRLTGKMSSKRVIVQPAAVVTPGLIPSDTAGTSQLVYSPVHLVE